MKSSEEEDFDLSGFAVVDVKWGILVDLSALRWMNGGWDW